MHSSESETFQAFGRHFQGWVLAFVLEIVPSLLFRHVHLGIGIGDEDLKLFPVIPVGLARQGKPAGALKILIPALGLPQHIAMILHRSTVLP